MASRLRLDLACFHGNSTHKSRRRVFSESPSLSQAFQADLAQSLHKLLHYKRHTMRHGETGHLSLSWICNAVDMVISTQASVKQDIAQHVDQEGVVHRYMSMEDNVLKLLDVCCLLKKALDGVHTYAKAAKNAVKHSKQMRGEGDLLRAKYALLSAQACLQELVGTDEMRVAASVRTAACGSLLRKMGSNLSNQAAALQQPDHTWTLSDALYAADMVTLFVFRILSAALPASPEARGGSISTLSISRPESAWERPPLICLEAQHNTLEQLARIYKRKRSAKGNKSRMTLLPEVHAMDASLKQMSNLVVQILAKRGSTAAVLCLREELSSLVQQSSKQVYTLESCTARLQQQLESVFRSLLDTRMALTRTSH